MFKEQGKFVVSLDFELLWGVRDVVTPQTYGQHIKGVHTALPRILSCFSKYSICGTFAAVGLLFFDNKSDLVESIPQIIPIYDDVNLSPYGDYIKNNVGDNYETDQYHFGCHLIDLIKNTPGQELGTHTFSHYYCLEPGQKMEDFKHDLNAAIVAAEKRGINITSIIFPRNQVNESYLPFCAEKGIICYRSNEDSWVYAARNAASESLFRRAIRLIDAYINLTGHHCYTNSYMNTRPVNIPASRFLRPYSNKLRMLESLRLRRIKKSMSHAAKNGLLYHLWWHPHNFGINFEQNFSFLEKILQHYYYLNQKYQFKSITMSDYAKRIMDTNGNNR